MTKLKRLEEREMYLRYCLNYHVRTQKPIGVIANELMDLRARKKEMLKKKSFGVLLFKTSKLILSLI